MLHFRVGARCALVCVLVSAAFGQSVSDPHVTSWVTAKSAQYARIYETSTAKTSGTSVTTWPSSGLTNNGGGVSTPTYSDVQRVAYSANYVYIYTTGLASYVMGNWLTPNGQVYQSWPANRAAIHRIPRNPSIPTTKQKNNGNGGVLVNGVYVWQNGDAQSYVNASSTSTTATISMQGDGIWNRLAGVAETFNFDSANGHQPSSGAYHNHINPKALRYQLGDNVTYDSANKSYSEAGTPTKHSPIIGWANDGLPIYGPYGYSSAMDSTSGVRRMTTGFVKRDSTNATLYGTDDLAVTGRVKLPVWAASVQGRSQTLSSSQYGPSTTATYALGPVNKTCVVGTFAEDYEYLGDLGKTQGVDFDLNRQNVRYCVTPEYPSGTYAYFVCIDSSGNTVFPDVINQEYFGSASPGTGTVTSISESVTEYADAGPAAAINVTATASGSNVGLSWNSAEGATYKVESSPDNATWTTLSSTVTSGGLTTSYTATTTANYYRVTLSAIATYDSGGTYGTPVGKTGTAQFGTVAAPAITTQPAAATVTVGTSVTFTVVASGSGLSYQWKKGGAVISGATNAAYTISSPQTADAGSYSVTVSNTAGSVTSDAVTLTVNAATTAPTITTQPTSQTVTAGTSVTFSVVATGTAPLTYQWSKGGAIISGATNASYSIAGVQASDAGTYSVAVTNTAGTASSSGATLTVTTAAVAPSITSQPANATATAGSAVTFSVAATGTAPLTYQWSKGGAAISGATSANYSIAVVQATDVGTYSVAVTNTAGTANSSGATLTVTTAAVAPSITSQPANVTATAGSAVTFSVVATGTTPLTYQWQKGGTAINGATNSSLALSNVQAADASSYVCVVSNAAGSATSIAATLTVTSTAVAPSIVLQPVSATATAGGSVTFSISATGTAPLTYQWQKGGAPVNGGTASSLTLSNVQAGDAGSYVCVVTNGSGTVTSAAATLAITTSAVAPTIVTHPASVTVTAGGSVSFNIAANGTAPLSYQWQKNGATISGATNSSLSLSNVQSTDAASYACSVSNSAGAITSNAAVLTVNPIATVATITITGQPSGATITAGGNVSFSVAAIGTGAGTLVYQWQKNGVAISGATGSTYTIAAAQATDAATYSVVVSGGGVFVTSAGAALTVNPAPQPAGIINLAVRTRVGGAAGTPITGFVLAGTGSGKRIVVRAVGPTLADFGVTGALADPQLQLWSGSKVVGANDNWTATDGPAMTAVGAFPLKSGSADAAIVTTLAPGGYTTPISAGGNGSGIVLIECYDGATADGSVRLVNASARAFVGTSDEVLIPGFVISGEGTVRVLIRAVGPTLGTFGVPGVLADPQLAIFQGTTVVGVNNDWQAAPNAPQVAAAAASAGAFPLVSGSADAALLIDLSAGAYTAKVSGVGDTTGTALVEVYVIQK